MIKETQMRVSGAAIAGIVLGLMVVSLNAGAATAMEEKIFKTPMPHTLLAEGAQVKADFVRLENDLTASRIAPKMAQNPQAILNACIADRKKRGLPVNPPRIYPSFDLPGHSDTYLTANRKITYIRAYTFRVNMDDCSLMEDEAAHATLSSSIGSCDMNLIARTAKGACDMEAHRKAPLWKRPTVDPDGMQAKMAEMSADPRRAAAMAQVRKLLGTVPAAAGQKKNVLGIECQVAGSPAGSSCSSKSGLVLESGAVGVAESKAVQAQLDASVNEAVFAPLGAGPLKKGQ